MADNTMNSTTVLITTSLMQTISSSLIGIKSDFIYEYLFYSIY